MAVFGNRRPAPEKCVKGKNMDNPLIDLGKLSEPLTKLIEVTSAGIGTLYRPFGTVRQAKAESKARIVAAKTENEITDLNERAKFRLEYQESIRQDNIEQIVVKAANELPVNVSEKSVDKDWILHFFDSAQNICDEEMQILWARVLSGEVAEPGSYSKRTLNFLKTMEKFEAEKFSEFCSFAFRFSDGWFFIFEDETTSKLMAERLGEQAYTNHFASIGLLSPEAISASCDSWDKFEIEYFKDKFVVNPTEEPDQRKGFDKLIIPFYFRIFSQIGQELSAIAGAKPISGFPEKISSSLEKDAKIKLIIKKP